MQRDNQFNRSEKWVFRNSLKNQGCVDYVAKLCDFYSIEKYCINDFKVGEPALFIIGVEITTILAIDVENTRLQAYRRKYRNSIDYYDTPTMQFENDSCWKQGIEWVAEQERLVCAS